jgi:hypothetical protein
VITITYATTTQIGDALHAVNSSLTIADIDTIMHTMASAEVDKALSILRVSLTTTPVDINNLLMSAEVCFYLELGCTSRKIEATYGSIKEETAGRVKKAYDSAMPMFFFASGSDASFLPLLTHETWRQRGFLFAQAWINASHAVRYPTSYRFGKMSTDITKRGYGSHRHDDYPYHHHEDVV